MTWREIRAHYAALHAQARAAGATQKAIADRGGIAGQNTVSRLLSNDNLGPSVEIFVRAIEGLGKPVSAFFLELEQGTVATLDAPAAIPASVVDRLQRLERTVEALGLSLSSLSSSVMLAASASSALTSSGHGGQVPLGNREERPSHGCSSISPGVINHNHIATLDPHRVEALFNTATESILAHLARLDARMAELGARDGHLPVRKAVAARGVHRRRTTKGA
jgi:transcriptional regulator with XRE-family HTH domain